MKKISLLVVLLTIFSCSKNDNEIIDNNGKPDPNDLITTTFLPTTNAIWWKYNTTTEAILPAPVAPATGITTGQDQLNVDSDVITTGISYKLMKTTATPTGFYSTILNNNKLRVDGSSIKITGNVVFNLGTNSIPLSVTDLTIFKENAVAGNTLSAPQSGTTPFSPPGSSLVFKINYIIKSVAQNDIASLVVNSKTYTNVKVVKLYVTVDARLLIIAPDNYSPALDPPSQDVIISTQYWVKNIGVVKADTSIEYNLNSMIPASVVPQKGKQTIGEVLDSTSF